MRSVLAKLLVFLIAQLCAGEDVAATNEPPVTEPVTKQQTKGPDVPALVNNINENLNRVNAKLTDILQCCKEHCNPEEKNTNPCCCQSLQLHKCCCSGKGKCNQSKQPPHSSSSWVFPDLSHGSTDDEKPTTKKPSKKMLVMILPIRRCVHCPCVPRGCPLVPQSVCPCQKSPFRPSSLLPCPVRPNQPPTQSFSSIKALMKLLADRGLLKKSGSTEFGKPDSDSLSNDKEYRYYMSAEGGPDSSNEGEHFYFSGEKRRLKRSSGIGEMLETGQPVAIQVSEDDTDSLRELLSMGFVDSKSTNNACGMASEQQPSEIFDRRPLFNGERFGQSSISIEDMYGNEILSQQLPAISIQYQQPQNTFQNSLGLNQALNTPLGQQTWQSSQMNNGNSLASLLKIQQLLNGQPPAAPSWSSNQFQPSGSLAWSNPLDQQQQLGVQNTDVAWPQSPYPIQGINSLNQGSQFPNQNPSDLNAFLNTLGNSGKQPSLHNQSHTWHPEAGKQQPSDQAVIPESHSANPPQNIPVAPSNGFGHGRNTGNGCQNAQISLVISSFCVLIASITSIAVFADGFTIV